MHKCRGYQMYFHWVPVGTALASVSLCATVEKLFYFPFMPSSYCFRKLDGSCMANILSETDILYCSERWVCCGGKWFQSLNYALYFHSPFPGDPLDWVQNPRFSRPLTVVCQIARCSLERKWGKKMQIFNLPQESISPLWFWYKESRYFMSSNYIGWLNIDALEAH